MMLIDWPTLAVLGAVAALLAWNFALGVRLAVLPDASELFRALSALCAFLFLPALVIGLLAPSAPGAHVLGPLAWLWPLVALAVMVQAAWGLVRGGASPVVALPIVVFDALIAWMAVVRWLDGVGVTMAPWALTPGFAAASLASRVLGSGALLWGAAALVPALGPAAPGRWRSTRVARVLVAAICTTSVVAVGVELPRAYDELSSVRTAGDSAGGPRTRDDLVVGLRLFGAVSGAPSAAGARHDVALADSLGVTALHIQLTEEGAASTTLDSVARAIELRRDSVMLVVTLGDGNGPAPATDDHLRARLVLIERIIRRLRPDVFVPAEPLRDGAAAPDVAQWRSYYERAAATARRIDRNVTVALGTTATSAADSVLVDWVMTGESSVDAVALVGNSEEARPAAYTASLHAMARWASLASTPPSVWMLGVPAAPAVLGEAIQQQLVRQALTWGASQSYVRGVIAGDASDGMAATGLRTASGRSRRAGGTVGALLRAQRELPAAPSASPETPTVDSLTAGKRREPPDTSSPPVR